MSDDAAKRIEALEIKIAYLEAQVLDLDEVLREFADEVVSLRRRLARFEGKVEDRLEAVEEMPFGLPGEGSLDPGETT